MQVRTRPDLAEIFEEDLIKPDSVAGRFVVDDDRKASWALERYREHQQQVDHIDGLATDRKLDIDCWREEAQKQHRRAMDYLQFLLAVYLEQSGQKTIKLPEGDIVRRALPAHIERDEKAISDWLREAGLTDYLKPAEVSWSALKDACEVRDGGLWLIETGERVPSAVVTDQGERYAVKVRD